MVSLDASSDLPDSKPLVDDLISVSSFNQNVVDYVVGFVNLLVTIGSSLVLGLVLHHLVAFTISDWLSSSDPSSVSDIDSYVDIFTSLVIVASEIYNMVFLVLDIVITTEVPMGTFLVSDAIDLRYLAFAVAYLPTVQPWSREQIVEDEKQAEIYDNLLELVAKAAFRTIVMDMVSSKP